MSFGIHVKLRGLPAADQPPCISEALSNRTGERFQSMFSDSPPPHSLSQPSRSSPESAASSPKAIPVERSTFEVSRCGTVRVTPVAQSADSHGGGTPRAGAAASSDA